MKAFRHTPTLLTARAYFASEYSMLSIIDLITAKSSSASIELEEEYALLTSLIIPVDEHCAVESLHNVSSHHSTSACGFGVNNEGRYQLKRKLSAEHLFSPPSVPTYLPTHPEWYATILSHERRMSDAIICADFGRRRVTNRSRCKYFLLPTSLKGADWMTVNNLITDAVRGKFTDPVRINVNR